MTHTTELELDSAILRIEYSWSNAAFSHEFGVEHSGFVATLESFTLVVQAANLDIDATLSLTDSQRSYIKGLALDHLHGLERDTQDDLEIYPRDPMDRDDD